MINPKCFFLSVGLLLLCQFPAEAQKIVVFNLEVIDFPVADAKKLSKILRQELSRHHPVLSTMEMNDALKNSNVFIPPHPGKNDLIRLVELFQGEFITTGLVTHLDNQFTINVRLIKFPAGDTLCSITKNIQGALLEPSHTFIPEIARQLSGFLPQRKTEKKTNWFKSKRFGIGVLITGAIVGYVLLAKETNPEPGVAKLPRPPKFP